MASITDNLSKEKYTYHNRDLSWLSFNLRVLEEADDNNLPLYERIKYLAIYSSNMDEFYRVRVASVRSILGLTAESRKKLDFNPHTLIGLINEEVTQQMDRFVNLFRVKVWNELAENGIILYQSGDKLSVEQFHFVEDYFYHEVMPHIQPSLLEKGKILSFLEDNVGYLAIRLCKKMVVNKNKTGTERVKHAIVRIPAHHVPRFLQIPSNDGNFHIMFLDDVIRLNLYRIFPGYRIENAYSIKVSRDAELSIEDEYKGNLMEKIRQSLIRRKTGAPARFLYDRSIPLNSLRLLREAFNLSKEDMVPGGEYHNLHDLHDFPNPKKPLLEAPDLPHMDHPILMRYTSIFDAIKLRDIMLHFPYHSFEYLISFLNEAATDPKVEEIKVTQYRVASNSAVVSALISAARNGKNVTVFVEVKARFDEAKNLYFADIMQRAGIKVMQSIPGIKVHSKVALVIRRSSKDNIRRGYAFVGTGNLNEKTAKQYADHGLFTSRQELVDELKRMFVYLETKSPEIKFKQLLVPNFNMVEEFTRLINREIEHVKKGLKGHMILKMNSLEEIGMINKLYKASEAGVTIDLIVRGICCLVPGQAYSKNIRVVRIIDRYLEHSRVFIFHNNGQNDTYISSADWMKRNLTRRVEAGVPIFDEEIKAELYQILQLQLRDNTKAHLITSDLEMHPILRSETDVPVRAQYDTHNFLYKKLLAAKQELEAAGIPYYDRNLKRDTFRQQ